MKAVHKHANKQYIQYRACSGLTGVTAGTVGSSCIHTGGTGVVTQVTPATWPELALGTLLHAAAVIQSPAADSSVTKTLFFGCSATKSTDMNYVYANEPNSFTSQQVTYGRVTQMKLSVLTQGEQREGWRWFVKPRGNVGLLDTDAD